MTENLIELSGIFSEGYGFVPKKLMRAEDLSSTTKLILCYLLSFTGAGVTCFPQIKDMADELNLSKDTIMRCLRQAQDREYLRKHQENRGGRIGKKNTYELLFMHSFGKRARGKNASSKIAPCTSVPEHVAPAGSQHVAPAYSNNNSEKVTVNNNSVTAFALLPIRGGMFTITEELVSELETENPQMDIRGALTEAVRWSERNPERRKTLRGAKTFLLNWIARDKKEGKIKAYWPEENRKEYFGLDYDKAVFESFDKKTAEEFSLTDEYKIQKDKIWDYYSARGWRLKGGEPIYDITAVIAAWLKRSFSGKFSER